MTTFPIEESRVYPAEHHFRIIVHAGSSAQTALEDLLKGYQVVAPLCRGRASSSGRYDVFQVTVKLTSRDEHIRLDTALRAVDGVRLLL